MDTTPDPAQPVPAIVTVLVLGVLYVAVLSLWAVARAIRWAIEAVCRGGVRLGSRVLVPRRSA